jgi:ribosome-binding protein aMBF1 (putative translation factor)
LKSFTHFNKPVSIPRNYELLVSELISARSERSLSQENLAHKIGCTASLIHKWETHKRIPSGFMLMCWLESLGYEITITKRVEDV